MKLEYKKHMLYQSSNWIKAEKLAEKWQDQQSEAFQQITQSLIEASTLGYPDFTLPIFLEIYASIDGLRAIPNEKTGQE